MIVFEDFCVTLVAPRLNPRSATQGLLVPIRAYVLIYFHPPEIWPRRLQLARGPETSALKLRQSYKRCFIIQSVVVTALSHFVNKLLRSWHTHTILDNLTTSRLAKLPVVDSFVFYPQYTSIHRSNQMLYMHFACFRHSKSWRCTDEM